jgi:NAD(P)-dependent dehydrogenase (short-subunit alcohol dehydrogenase family)
MGVLEGRTVLVTGAGQGIGRAIALQSAAAGARVVVNDVASIERDGVRSALADEVVAQIRSAGGEAVAAIESIRDPQGAERIVSAALDAFGGLDAVVNNAGILRDRMFHNMDEAEWDDVVQVHLYGYYRVSRAAATHFRSRNAGAFLHFGSASGLIGNVGQANYAAAKMGVVGLSTGIALDMARYNVRSNVIAPWAWSALVATVPTRTPEEAERMRKVREGMRPEQVAPLCVFLVSDAAAGITGQIFGARGNELYVFSQPRILRSAHSAAGWTPESIGAVAMPALSGSFTAVRPHREIVGWDPI